MSAATRFQKLPFSLRAVPLTVLVFATGSAALAQSPSQTISVQLDPARTAIHFTSGTFLHRVHGSMQLKGGLFAYDPATGVAQGQIIVDAESVKTGDAKLDERIQKEALESGKYPEIFFHPEKSSGTIAGTSTSMELSGSFTIHGSDHAMKAAVTRSGPEDDPMLTTTFSVPYTDWGMRNISSWWMPSKTIEVTVEAHGKVETLAPRSKG